MNARDEVDVKRNSVNAVLISYYILLSWLEISIRCRPAVRISGFHPGDPGSIPGNGIFIIFSTKTI